MHTLLIVAKYVCNFAGMWYWCDAYNCIQLVVANRVFVLARHMLLMNKLNMCTKLIDLNGWTRHRKSISTQNRHVHKDICWQRIGNLNGAWIVEHYSNWSIYYTKCHILNDGMRKYNYSIRRLTPITARFLNCTSFVIHCKKAMDCTFFMPRYYSSHVYPFNVYQ